MKNRLNFQISNIQCKSCKILIESEIGDMKGVNNINVDVESGKVEAEYVLALFYNSIGIPIAASGLLRTEFAGLAMALSIVSVVTNSLLLKRKNLYPKRCK